MIRLPLVNTFMKQLHPLNTITVDFKSNCRDETEVMKDENPSKSIAAFNVESTDVTNTTFGLQLKACSTRVRWPTWYYHRLLVPFQSAATVSAKIVTSYSTFISMHYEVSLDFLARSVVQVKKCGRSIFSVLKWVKCSPTTCFQASQCRWGRECISSFKEFTRLLTRPLLRLLPALSYICWVFSVTLASLTVPTSLWSAYCKFQKN